MTRELQRAWEETRADLERARSCMPRSIDSQIFDQYTQFVDANELELALDELEAIAGNTACPPEFWQSLLAAAERMNLTEHVPRLSLAHRRAMLAV